MHISRKMFSFLAITGALFGSDLRMPLIHPQLRFDLPEECRMCDESSPANGARYVVRDLPQLGDATITIQVFPAAVIQLRDADGNLTGTFVIPVPKKSTTLATHGGGRVLRWRPTESPPGEKKGFGYEASVPLSDLHVLSLGNGELYMQIEVWAPTMEAARKAVDLVAGLNLPPEKDDADEPNPPAVPGISADATATGKP